MSGEPAARNTPMSTEPSRRKTAYVTLVTNADFARGAAALIRSLALTGTQADILVMHTGGVDDKALRPLADRGAGLVPVAMLPTSIAFNERHARNQIHARNPFGRGRKPLFHTPLDNFCKLRLWELETYERIVFLDADTIVLRNIDRMFDYPEFSAAPNVHESLSDFHRLNSGVFVARPSRATFATMLDRLDAPDAYWPRTDQTFLQSFFPDWHGLPVTMNMLQYVWFNLPGLWDWNSIGVLHFQYEKPWELDHPRAGALAPLIALWQAFAGEGPVPDIAGLPGPATN